MSIPSNEIAIEAAIDKLSINQTLESNDARSNLQGNIPRTLLLPQTMLIHNLFDSPLSTGSHLTPHEEEKPERVTSTHSDSPIPQTAKSMLIKSPVKHHSVNMDTKSNLEMELMAKKTTSIPKLGVIQPFKRSNTPIYFGDRPPTEYVVSQRDRFFRNQDSIFNSKIRSSATSRSIRLSTQSSDNPSNSNLKANTASGSGKLSLTNEAKTGLKKDESAKYDSEDSLFSPIPEASNYRIEMGTLIGQGGYGKVYHGIICDTNTHIAIKIAPLRDKQHKSNVRGSRINRLSQGTAQPKPYNKAAAALEREMLLLSELEHENIVKFIGIDILYIDHRV
ncbi:hypothetical protein HDV02_000955 [Globomyces sp. JEL0801]|nr:hypothetical protein HDV02_000955 [Globomyces sp. JEL0801]